MTIKRYNTEELQKECEKIFYDCLISNSYQTGISLENIRPKTDVAYEGYLTLLKENEERQRMYASEIVKRNQAFDKTSVTALTEQLTFLQEEHFIVENMNMNSQKQRYITSGKIDYTRTVLKTSLNKKINSLYDDFDLFALFYDDVFTLKGKHDIYEQLETDEERMIFLKENTELTHMALINYKPNSRQILCCIGLLGELNSRERRVMEGNMYLLPQKFSDFESLRLNDLNIIKNNDLRQILQGKIDLDKENMELLATTNIRGSEYKLLKRTEDELYIRYVCDSTGRVYYNLLNINNLKLSSYFDEGKPKSYLEAWWNITHLGANVYGKDVIAC